LPRVLEGPRDRGLHSGRSVRRADLGETTTAPRIAIEIVHRSSVSGASCCNGSTACLEKVAIRASEQRDAEPLSFHAESGRHGCAQRSRSKSIKYGSIMAFAGCKPIGTSCRDRLPALPRGPPQLTCTNR
jgi:hypothetical protein